MKSKISVIIEDELKSQLIDDSALYGKSLSQFFIDCYKFFQTNRHLCTLPKIGEVKSELRKKVYKTRAKFTKNLASMNNKKSNTQIQSVASQSAATDVKTCREASSIKPTVSLSSNLDCAIPSKNNLTKKLAKNITKKHKVLTQTASVDKNKTTVPLTLNTEQKLVIDCAMSGNNIFITGGAGVGKSFTLNHLINKLRQKGQKEVIVCAPTGIAAQNVQGVTLHRAFKISIYIDPEEFQEKLLKIKINSDDTLTKLLKCMDVLVIDEISMCRADTFTYLVKLLKVAEILFDKTYQVIVCGDFLQLPPVVKENKEKEYLAKYFSNNAKMFSFNQPEWNSLNLRKIELTKVIRQKDEQYSNALNEVRKGNIQGLSYILKHCSKKENENATYITIKNAEAENKNIEFINKLSGELRTYKMSKSGDILNTDIVCLDKLSLKVGARVVFIANISECDCSAFNGQIGEVTELQDNLVIVKTDQGLQTVTEYEWDVKEYVYNEEKDRMELKQIGSYKQIPLKPAYAVTVHKSQGQTYEAVNIDSPNFFVTGQLYVALSRCKSLDKMYICPELKNRIEIKKDIPLADSDVINFYNK